MNEANTAMESKNKKNSPFVPIAFCVFVGCALFIMIFVSSRHETLSPDLLLEIQMEAIKAEGYGCLTLISIIAVFWLLNAIGGC